LPKHTIVSPRAEDTSKSIFTKSEYAPAFTIGSTKNAAFIIRTSCSNYAIFIFRIAIDCNHFEPSRIQRKLYQQFEIQRSILRYNRSEMQACKVSILTTKLNVTRCEAMKQV